MKKKILIVEDTPETIELLRRIVEKGGYEPLIAKDGDKGLDYCFRYKPDLILLDRLLPYVNGLQICRELRNRSDTEDIPIIFVSVLNSEKDIIEGLKAGADDYVGKPFSPDELLARIEAVLRRYEKQETRKEKTR